MKNAKNSEKFDFELVMTLFVKFWEKYWHNLQIFESRWRNASLGLEFFMKSRSRSLGLAYYISGANTYSLMRYG